MPRLLNMKNTPDQNPSTRAAPATEDPTPANGDAPSVYLETFGCQMNVLDSQLVTGQLRALGYRFTDDWSNADVVLYNTCSVREHAEQKVWSRIGKVGKHKSQVPGVVLGVIGCMAERDGQDMMHKHPQVDLLCGPGELDKLPTLIDNAIRTHPDRRGGKRNGQAALQGNATRRSATLAAAEDDLELLDLSRSFAPDDQLSGGRSAYVRITRGCNKFCTYCVVPHTRGREIHRPPSSIVEECRKLAASGVTEITLLGQTVNHYHFDHRNAVEMDGVLQPQIGAAVKNNGTSFEAHGLRPWDSSDDGAQDVTTFAMLLRQIHDACPSVTRLRFITSFPRDFGNDILETIRDCPRICRYLHLPVQHGSDRVLAGMNRGYTAADFLDLVERARETIPGVELATDIITGFPGETEQDHQKTLGLLERCRFKSAFIFKYSPRPGTTAYDRLEDDVPEAVKKRRNHELLDVQTRMSEEVHQGYVGKTVEVFVESLSRKETKAATVNAADPKVTLGWEAKQQQATATIDAEQTVQLTGRTDGDLIVVFDGTADLIGTSVQCKIERCTALTLFGTVV